MKTLYIVITLLTASAFSAREDMDILIEDSKSDLMVVGAAGAAGGLLGLSTLSFVDEPTDNTKNILIGASLGIIAGVAWVGLMQAEKTSSYYYGGQRANGYSDGGGESGFTTYQRNHWHQESHRENNARREGDIFLTHSFQF